MRAKLPTVASLHPADLPASLISHLTREYGAMHRAEQLRGLSQAEVYCVRLKNNSVVVKITSSDREVGFYRFIAPVLRKQGVPFPALEWIHQEEEGFWMLVLEHVPQKLPRKRWLADPEVLQALASLHKWPGHKQSSLIFRPEWSDEMTTVVVSCFAGLVQERLHGLLDRVRLKAMHLFEPLCWISGDPNPTNWGLRLDNHPVLFDWERFGRGHPALDLAITVPGLGDETDYNKVAAAYLKGAASTDNAGVLRLTRDVALAKIWSVVEFLHTLHSGGGRRDGMDLDWLMTSLPVWLIHTGGIADPDGPGAS